jgi:rare lipoprotein A
MWKRIPGAAALVIVSLAMVQPARAQTPMCDELLHVAEITTSIPNGNPATLQAGPPANATETDPSVDLIQARLTRYSALAAKHRLCGLASYYSASLEGTLTANGERYHNKKMSAAHLTLPLGCWVEVRSRATGRTLRLRVNDRGPYAHKFMLDLSYAAAHALGVDEAEDRHVDVRIIGLPGEDPLPEASVAAWPDEGRIPSTAVAAK